MRHGTYDDFFTMRNSIASSKSFPSNGILHGCTTYRMAGLVATRFGVIGCPSYVAYEQSALFGSLSKIALEL